MMEKKFKLNAAMINKNRAFLLLAIVLFCGLFVDNFYTAYNIRAVTGNGSLVIWLGLGFTIVLIAYGYDSYVHVNLCSTSYTWASQQPEASVGNLHSHRCSDGCCKRPDHGTACYKAEDPRIYRKYRYAAGSQGNHVCVL